MFVLGRGDSGEPGRVQQRRRCSLRRPWRARGGRRWLAEPGGTAGAGRSGDRTPHQRPEVSGWWGESEWISVCVLTFGTDTKQHHFFLKVPKYLSNGMCRPPSEGDHPFALARRQASLQGKSVAPLTIALKLGMVQIMELVTAGVVLKPCVGLRRGERRVLDVEHEMEGALQEVQRQRGARVV